MTCWESPDTSQGPALFPSVAAVSQMSHSEGIHKFLSGPALLSTSLYCRETCPDDQAPRLLSVLCVPCPHIRGYSLCSVWWLSGTPAPGEESDRRGHPFFCLGLRCISHSVVFLLDV